MKNRIVAIGYVGNITCYLNVPKEEAIRRYIEKEGGLDGENIDEFEFEDEFEAYSVNPA